MKRSSEMYVRLAELGIILDDALALRRISMALHRWFELECGGGNSRVSWAIERDEQTEKPFHVYYHDDVVTRTAIPDREAAARKRLAKIMAKYPELGYYVQTDPRGASLYVFRASDIPEGKDVECCYTRGIAVYK